MPRILLIFAKLNKMAALRRNKHSMGSSKLGKDLRSMKVYNQLRKVV
jgi:hypothetical protein